MELTSLTRGDAGRPMRGGSDGRRKVDWTDAAFALLLVVGAAFAFHRVGDIMTGYDKAILVGAVAVMAWLGWLWRPLRVLMLAVAAGSGLALGLYQGELARAEQAFLLKYLLSSQSA